MIYLDVTRLNYKSKNETTEGETVVFMDGLQRVTLDHAAVNLNIGDRDVRNLLAQARCLRGVDTEHCGELCGGVDAVRARQRFDDLLDQRRVSFVLCGGTSGGGLIQLAQGFGGVRDDIIGDLVVGYCGEKFLVRHGFLFPFLR